MFVYKGFFQLWYFFAAKYSYVKEYGRKSLRALLWGRTLLWRHILYMLKEHSDVIKDVGTLAERPYHIRLKEDSKPVQHPPRSVPVNMQLQS